MFYSAKLAILLDYNLGSVFFREDKRVSLLLYFSALTKESSGGKQPPFSINWF